jgi:hypothetical protein
MARNSSQSTPRSPGRFSPVNFALSKETPDETWALGAFVRMLRLEDTSEIFGALATVD